MRALAAVLLLAAAGAQAAPDDLTLRELKNLSMERCLALPAAELATRCPSLAGRAVEIDHARLALVDRVDARKGSFLCDQGAAGWRCRRIVVIDRDLRLTRKRDPKQFVTAGELLRQLATASTVKLGDELGALLPPGLPPRSCVDAASRGCAVQAARLRARAPDKSGAPTVRRRLWLVEDADGATLQCSDAALTRCDELGAAGWLALAVTLRPSSLAPPELPPELDLPEVRSDKRASTVAALDAAETPAGAPDPWARPKASQALPKAPSRADVTKAAHALELAGRGCVSLGDAAATVGVVFSGEGALVSLAVDGAAPGDTVVQCLTTAARKLAFPRFDGASYRLQAVVLPHAPEPPRARRRR